MRKRPRKQPTLRTANRVMKEQREIIVRLRRNIETAEANAHELVTKTKLIVAENNLLRLHCAAMQRGLTHTMQVINELSGLLEHSTPQVANV
jgi:hypothetical protein